MVIEDFTVLRSLRNEAERQFDFYSRRNQASHAEFWNELAAVATVALTQQSGPWEIILRENVNTLPIIKPCEQGQQPQNNNVIKAFR